VVDREATDFMVISENCDKDNSPTKMRRFVSKIEIIHNDIPYDFPFFSNCSINSLAKILSIPQENFF